MINKEFYGSDDTSTSIAIPSRSQEMRNYALARLEPAFTVAWDSRFLRGAEPVELSFGSTGNALPVGLSVHETDYCFVIGLFEINPENIEPIGIRITTTGVMLGSLYCSTGEYLSGIYEPPRETEDSDPYFTALRKLNKNLGIRLENRHRGKGLGTILYDATMLLARYTNSKRVFFDRLTAKSIAIIKHLGYQIESENMYRQNSLIVEV